MLVFKIHHDPLEEGLLQKGAYGVGFGEHPTKMYLLPSRSFIGT